MLFKSFKQMAALSIIGAMSFSQIADARPPQRLGTSRNLPPTQRNAAKDAPKPTAPATVWLKYINEDIKAPTPRPKPSTYPQRGRFGTSNAPRAKDAPPPTAPPTVWLKYINEDIKAPTPRPKPSTYPQRGRFGTSNAPRAKDAPPPTAPPTVWLKYINEDIKAPTPRPKPSTYPQRGRFGTSNAPRAKDAPKPTDPPIWKDYHRHYQTPKPRPKAQIPTNRFYVDYRRPDSTIKVPPPRARKPLPPTFPRDVKVPYTHPPRDLKPKNRR